MASPETNQAILLMEQAKAIAEKLGLKKEAQQFQKFHSRFQTQTVSYKVLRDEVEDVRNGMALKVKSLLYDEWRKPLAGKEALAAEHEKVSSAILQLIYPLEPPIPELNLKKIKGAELLEDKKCPYYGDKANVPAIAEQCLALASKYSALMGTGEFEKAYELTGPGLRAWMSFKRFKGEHDRATKEYEGPALQFDIERFVFIYADDKARKKSNTVDEAWPKATPKEARRAMLNGFWIRDRKDQTGCGGSLWIAEHNGVYTIEKFDFWVP